MYISSHARPVADSSSHAFDHALTAQNFPTPTSIISRGLPEFYSAAQSSNSLLSVKPLNTVLSAATQKQNDFLIIDDPLATPKNLKSKEQNELRNYAARKQADKISNHDYLLTTAGSTPGFAEYFENRIVELEKRNPFFSAFISKTKEDNETPTLDKLSAAHSATKEKSTPQQMVYDFLDHRIATHITETLREVD